MTLGTIGRKERGMKIEDYIKATYKICNMFERCQKCPAYLSNIFDCALHGEYAASHPSHAIAIVERFVKEHPNKTVGTEIEKFLDDITNEEYMLERVPAGYEITILNDVWNQEIEV